MGCVCCSLSSFVSILLNALERISLCTVCAMLICCLLFTILTVLVMGIGIGFHYCTVQNSVEGMEKAAQAAGGALRSQQNPSPMMRSVNKAVKRGFAHRLNRRDMADAQMPSNNNTINDEILLGRNFTVTSHRAKRDLASGRELPHANNTMNDTIPLFNFTTLNDTLTYKYDDDGKGNITDELVDSRKPFNKTINDAILLRANCTLLHFFTRFF